MKRSIIKMWGMGILTLVIPLLANAAGTITNTANLEYKDPGGGTYTAVGICAIRKIGTVNVTIVKGAWNITRRGTHTTTYFGTETGVAGDVVEYQVKLENIGEDTAKYVVLRDTLPNGVTYATGTIRFGTESLTDDRNDDKGNYGTSTNTISVGENEAKDNGNIGEITIPGGKEVYIYYRVRVD